jgi:hypothetical protein
MMTPIHPVPRRSCRSSGLCREGSSTTPSTLRGSGLRLAPASGASPEAPGSRSGRGRLVGAAKHTVRGLWGRGGVRWMCAPRVVVLTEAGRATPGGAWRAPAASMVPRDPIMASQVRGGLLGSGCAGKL